MKNAKQAKQELEDLMNEKSNLELKSIELKINDAIQKLKNKIVITGCISPKTKKILEENFYVVGTDKKRNTFGEYVANSETETIISF